MSDSRIEWTQSTWNPVANGMAIGSWQLAQRLETRPLLLASLFELQDKPRQVKAARACRIQDSCSAGYAFESPHRLRGGGL